MIRWDELKKAPRIRQGKRKSIEWDKLKKMPAVPVDTSAGMYNNPSRQQSRSQSTAQSDFADWQPSFGFQNLGARENYLQRASSGAVPETAAQKFLPELYDRGFGGYGSPSGSGSGGEWENEPILTGEAMDTALSILAGAYGIKLDMDRAGQDVYMPKLSPAGLTAPMKMSLDNHQIMDYDEDNMRQLPYETAPGKSPSQGTVGWGAVSDYLGKSAKQIILGSGTEDVTALGTVGQIGLSFTGADLPMDARDLYYDLTHWDGTLEHSIQTGLDALAFIPVIGTLKYGDEAWDLVKAALKKLDEFTDIGKSADKGLDFAGELEKTILKNTDEATDATGSAFKASTEGAGDAGKIADDSNNTKFTYKNNPMDNPKASKDIVENPNAVYGYSPNPQSERIGKYADYDWTNSKQVELAKTRREVYHIKNANIKSLVDAMRMKGASAEDIARAANELRNQNRLNDYINDPIGLEKVKQSNLKVYGNEKGLTAEEAYKKYGSWENMIESSMNSNPGMDACCGLYDKYYLGGNRN